MQAMSDQLGRHPMRISCGLDQINARAIQSFCKYLCRQEDRNLFA